MLVVNRVNIDTYVNFTISVVSCYDMIKETAVIITVKLFTNEGIRGITHLKRNVNSDNARRKLDGRAETHIIEIACGPAPEGHARWTLLFLEKKAKIEFDIPDGKNAIGWALKKAGFDLTKTTTGASPKKKMQNS